MQHSHNVAVANIEGQVVDRGERDSRRRGVVQRKQDASNNLSSKASKQKETIKVV